MKGLLKGLRYISQIFDAKEPEMQIGKPTDVKHVAHIGWDNASVTAPSWMNEFKASPGAPRGSEPEPSQPGGGGGEGAGGCGEEQSGGGEAGGKAERPRRTRGKGSGGGEAKRRDGAGEGSRRDRRLGKTDSEGGSERDAAAPKQRRRKPRASGGGTSSGGRSKSSSGGAGGCGPASDSEAARPGAAPEAEDDRDGC